MLFDNITTIKATNSLTANVGKDLNLTGAVLLSDNLEKGSRYLYFCIRKKGFRLLCSSRNDTTINASKNTFNQGTKTKAWNESITLASTNAGGAGAVIDKWLSEASNLQLAQLKNKKTSEYNAVNAASVALGVGMSRSKSDTSSTNYNNSSLVADSGTIKINTLNDATIKGANLLAQDIILNTAEDLTVVSLQDSFQQKGNSFGLSLGGGAGVSGGGSANFGINYGSSKTDRVWTDNQTSILGTNSVTINTGNNTDIIGAVIANSINGKIGGDTQENIIDGGNLTLNTNSLTYSNLYDHDYSRSSGFGISISEPIGIGSSAQGSAGNSSTSSANNTTGQGVAPANNPNQQNNFYPNGSTTISAQNQGYQKEQTTFATIGDGNITVGSTQIFDLNGNLIYSTGGTTNDVTQLTNLNRDINNTQEITKDTITGALNTSITIDNRIFTAAGWKSIGNDHDNIGRNLATSHRAQGKLLQGVREVVEDALGSFGTAITTPISVVEGTIFTFLEQKDVAGGAQLRIKNLKTSEIEIITDPTAAKVYALNGINNNIDDIINSYFQNTKPGSVVERENPTHGAFGDLVESGLGKMADWFGLENVIAMNRIAEDDIAARSNMSNAVNLYHSQGTIIAKGAMQAYADDYMQPTQLTNPITGEITTTYTNQINPTQKFVAVGPAVLKSDWEKTVGNLGLDILTSAPYKHDDQDPVRYLAAPSNLINDVVKITTGKDVNSPVYVPNLIVDTPIGIWDAILHMDKHSVTNPTYSKFLQPSSEQNSQNPSTAQPR